MNDYSDPSSSIASNLREWEYLKRIADGLDKIKSISNNLKQGSQQRPNKLPISEAISYIALFFSNNALSLVISKSHDI